MSEVNPDVCKFNPAPAAEITVDQARVRVKAFAGVEPVIVRTSTWLPGQESPRETWRVRIYKADPSDLETGGVTLSGAVEQLRAAVSDMPGWRKP